MACRVFRGVRAISKLQLTKGLDVERKLECKDKVCKLIQDHNFSCLIYESKFSISISYFVELVYLDFHLK